MQEETNASDVKHLEHQVAELTETVKRYKENGALAVKRIKLLTAHKEKMEKQHEELKAQLEAAGPQEVPDYCREHTVSPSIICTSLCHLLVPNQFMMNMSHPDSCLLPRLAEPPRVRSRFCCCFAFDLWHQLKPMVTQG